MAEEKIKLIVGDWSDDGHGKSDEIPLLIKVDNCDNVKKALVEAEKILFEQYNIDLTLWFAEYEDNKLRKYEVEKLIRLGIEFDKQNIDENGELVVYDANEFYEIWKQLIVKANPNISIEKIKLGAFVSKCSGYGIYV
jgi:hypothetical protein